MKKARMQREPEAVRSMVRDRYGLAALRASSCCGAADASRAGTRIGYTPEQLEGVPDGANLGLGCGNPTALASLSSGEVVLDLGCGAGMDVFLAARKVGGYGRVIGVDMTEAMLVKARENAERGGFTNVEFRRGEIESLPVEDAGVDVVLSNCVINLSPEKDRVFAEAFRVLVPGGRLMISDIVLERPLPAEVRDSVLAYVGCVAGASLREDYLGLIGEAGFVDVRIVSETHMSDTLGLDDPMVAEAIGSLDLSPEKAHDVLDSITSLSISATKPA